MSEEHSVVQRVYDARGRHGLQKETAPQAKELSKDDVINIVLQRAGVNRSEVSFDDIELDTDYGFKIWEISFDTGIGNLNMRLMHSQARQLIGKKTMKTNLFAH